jgi:hypothetical protein
MSGVVKIYLVIYNTIKTGQKATILFLNKSLHFVKSLK